jgi:hypothetical protein
MLRLQRTLLSCRRWVTWETRTLADRKTYYADLDPFPRSLSGHTARSWQYLAMRKKKNISGRRTKKASPLASTASSTSPASTPEMASPKTGKGASKSPSLKYSPEQRAEIVQFVHDYNAKNVRGGQAAASKKYGISVLSISKWLTPSGKPAKRNATGGTKRPPAATKSVRVSESIDDTLRRMLDVQTKLDRLKAEYVELRDRL